MTHEEAKKVAGIVAAVDGYCHVCARSAAAALLKEIPEHDWAQLVAEEHYSRSSDNEWVATYAESIRKEARGE